MEELLNFDAPLNIDLLDRVCHASVMGSPAEVVQAQSVLNQFKEHENAWQAVDTILEQTQSDFSRYFALSVLEPVIKYKWKAMPREQQEGIKNYIVEKVVKISSDEDLMREQEMVLHKLNIILVQIIKQEWPRNWNTFVDEIVASSKTNESLCENNMIIFSTLSQEVFDFAAGQLTKAKAQELKDSFQEQFLSIYQLCEFVLTESVRPSLLSVTLDTLSCFLSWIPAGYVFQFNLVPMLIQKFLPVEQFRNGAMKCLIEIATIDVGDPENYAKFLHLFVESLMTFLPIDTDIAAAVENGSEEDCEFIQNLSLFLTNFFKTHRTNIENPQYADALLAAHTYLANVSLVDEEEVFKICLEYWGILAKDLFFEVKSGSAGVLMLSGGDSARRRLYAPVLETVRLAMVMRMARPEEVIVTEDENGNLIREHLKDTESINMYQNMRETLVYLTHLDPVNTANIMGTKLAEQRQKVIDREHKDTWWTPLNRICWAVGSTSGVQQEDREKRFLVNVIKDLLAMCEVAKGKDNKAVIATNIMYVVGQYPRFLNEHWKFLRTVVNKLFEFMHERHPGVQDMACDTFLKISKSCRRRFVTVQLGEHRPYIIDILQRLPDIISMLKPNQLQSFYESVGYMISSSSSNKEQLVRELMSLPNEKWMEVMSEAKATNAMALRDPEAAKLLTHILQTNVRAATSLGDCYILQIRGFFGDILLVYRTYSVAISQAVAEEGPKVTRTSLVKSWRSVKQEILNLLSVFVQGTTDPAMMQEKYLPEMLGAVLVDYNENHPLARDAEVLALLTTIIKTMKSDIGHLLPRIFDTVFDCTVEMIRENYNDFPQVRVEFFGFLRAVNAECFPALMEMGSHVGGFVDSVVWAFKHTRPDIADMGLYILDEFWENVRRSDAANAFYQTYVTQLVDTLFYVLVDTFHKPGFKMQAVILRKIFLAVECNEIPVPLFDTSKHSFSTNKEYLLHYVADVISKAFQNLSQARVEQFSAGLFIHSNDPGGFKNHLRDFLVQTKEFGDDNEDLYLEEQEQQRSEIAAMRKAIPGLVKPADDEMDG